MKKVINQVLKKIESHEKNIQMVYMIILALYPLMRVNQGISVMDTTYSLSNYAFFRSMDGTWMVATYLSNVLGSMLMELPGGNSLLGMNVYTSLVVSVLAVAVFIYLKRDVPSHVLFISELIALGLCWCPTTLLYNYLTYLLFALGTLTLYRGVCGGRDDCYVAAGILLGLNVATRFPNITEAAMIIVVWYVGVIEHKKIGRVFKETFMCLGGYLLGFGLPLIIITIRYNASAYLDMIHNLFAMTDKATDYKPTSMITAMFSDYIYAAEWICIFIIAFVGCAIIHVLLSRLPKIKCRELVGVALSVLVCLMATLVCYRHGMFTFNYYEYRSMYFWAVILILAITIVGLIYMFLPEKNITQMPPVVGEELVFHRKKILAVISLITIYITCIGSNNALYPSVNNLFIPMIFIMWVVYGHICNAVQNGNKKKSYIDSITYGMSVVCTFLICVLLVQSIGFHIGFAIQDGDDGTPRDAQVQRYTQTAGVYTTHTNANNLQGLMDYMNTETNENQSVILYGNIPGMGFLLNRPSALTTFWPDLNSYTYAEWSEDLKKAENMMHLGDTAPYIVTSIQVAAWEGGDDIAIDYWGINREKFEADTKLNDLIELMHKMGYEQVYCNDAYAVYSMMFM